MRIFPQLLFIGIVTLATPKTSAESSSDKPTHEDELTAQFNAEYLQLMEKDRDRFIEDSREPHLIAFIVRVESKLEREVIRTIQGKIPSDALNYVADYVPPGFYVVGILRPTAQQAFNGNRDTRNYILPIVGDDWNKERLMQTDLEQLINKKKPNKAEMATPRKPSD